MTAEFDEEVVFENSPLYQYLQDLGHTDFEICQTVLEEGEQCTEEEQHDQDVHTVPKQGIFTKLAEILKSPFTSRGQTDDQIHRLDVGFRLDCLCTILQQEALLQEDVELIELLNPSILSAGQPQQPESGHLPTLRSLATPNIWDASVLLALVSSLALLESWSVSSWAVRGPTLFALAVYVALRAVKIWRSAKLQMTLRKYSLQLEETVANSRAFTNLVRKALRLIQETEVISRGFTLVSAACPYDKSGQHPSQHLFGLRKAVYRSVRANFRASRSATLYMLKNYPLNLETDNVTNYICVVPLKELGLGLSKQQVLEEEAHNLTDGFSLPALKVMFQLWIGQSSEFFRRLALLLSPENELPRGLGVAQKRLPHRIWRDVSQALTNTHATCLAELRRSYEFYRYFETQHQSGSERLIKTKPRSGELNGLHRAVRSLQLHLKALLNEIIIFEDELENLAGPKETQKLTAEAYEVLEWKLKLIQPHIQASNSCWEEAICQVERMLRRHPENKDLPKPCCENSHCASMPSSPPALLIEDKDPIPDEQELEACVEGPDLGQEHRGDELYCCWSQEDKEKQRRDQEESKRVLQELKSVLGFKASEEERQKWKQLLFSEHAVMKPLSPVETEGSPEPLPNNSAESTEPAKAHEAVHEKNQVAALERLGTECRSEDPVRAGSADASAPAEACPRDEVRPCYRRESGEDSERAGGEGTEAVLGGALQSSVKDRLARLRLSPDFSFTSGLAAEVAARSFSFASMQEQTFGDSEEEEQTRGNENHAEADGSEDGRGEDEGR
ncbi:vezatin isoform X2 [Rhinatrema bivittatum]|uniref:vezatin isoform X2 n=1 Tax=Rhinatrema bivittatum TaxID=194408 RepID=UPI00112A493B|nr:vezatin isoform X2 [Rhinatrema bivittatum]